MNNLTINGRLVKDAEIGCTANTQAAKAKFTIANEVGFGDRKHTNFINVICFGKTAEFAEKWLAKGNRVIVEGELRTGSYEGKDGKKVYTTDIFANRIEPIDWKEKSPADDFQAIDDDNSLPF